MSENIKHVLGLIDWAGKGFIGLLISVSGVFIYDTYNLTKQHTQQLSAHERQVAVIEAQQKNTIRELDAIQKKLDWIIGRLQ